MRPRITVEWPYWVRHWCLFAFDDESTFPLHTIFTIFFRIRSNRHSSEIYRQNVNKILLNSLDIATPAMNKHTTNRFIFKALGFRMKSNILNGDDCVDEIKNKNEFSFLYWPTELIGSVCILKLRPKRPCADSFHESLLKISEIKIHKFTYVYRFLVPFLSCPLLRNAVALLLFLVRFATTTTTASSVYRTRNCPCRGDWMPMLCTAIVI